MVIMLEGRGELNHTLEREREKVGHIVALRLRRDFGLPFLDSPSEAE
jgi:hypothetical protein